MSKPEDLLVTIPKPSFQHIKALDRAVESVVYRKGLSQAEETCLYKAVEKLETFVHKFKDGVRLEIAGGSAALKDSEVKVIVSGTGPARCLLVQVFRILQKHGEPEYVNVSEDFSGKECVRAEEAETGRQFVLFIRNHADIALGQFLQLYASADSRLHKLAIMLRTWAQICQLDHPEAGTLPVQAFDIMVIYFLQHIFPPVLPVFSVPPKTAIKWHLIPEVVRTLQSQAKGWESENRSSAGELWVQLLRFYSCQFSVTSSIVSVHGKNLRRLPHWSCKKLVIQDPIFMEQNMAGSLQKSSMVDFFWSSWCRAYEYFGMPRNKTGNVAICIDHLRQLAKEDKDRQLGETEEMERQIKQNDRQSQENARQINEKEIQLQEKNSGPLEEKVKQLEIKEDGDRPPEEKQKKEHQLEKRAEKDGQLQEKDRWLQEKERELEEKERELEQKERWLKEKDKLQEEKERRLEAKERQLEERESQLKEKEGCVEERERALEEKERQIGKTKGAGRKNTVNVRKPGAVCSCLELEEGDMFSYDLFSSHFKTVKKPVLPSCGSCRSRGHTKASCPERGKRSTVLQLPTPSPQHLDMVNEVIANIPHDFRPNKDDLKQRSLIVERVKGLIQSNIPDASIEVFGSTANGFDFFSSDLDISISFGEQPREDDGDHGRVRSRLQKVARILSPLKEFTDIEVITHARVPIVKFTHVETKLGVDISVSNLLGIHNTRLLHCYTKIDGRVQILGLAVKVFAKACEIGDASLGSLSSYTYILMMLHYLQQCQPPVIPVLQELYPEGGKPDSEEFMVDGCDVWFFDDLEQLPEVWSGYGQNKDSVGELWLGFLRYYVNHFNWKTTVVSIRQVEPLTKFEKMWTGHCLAVEDPFDVERNLGKNLTGWVSDCILYTFQCGAQHFWTPVQSRKEVFKRFLHVSDFFFDIDMLTGGSSSRCRYCPACQQNGHTFRICPVKGFVQGRHRNVAKKKTLESQAEKNMAATSRRT